MDDSRFGTRNRKGGFEPNERPSYPPVIVWPPRPVGFARWLLGYPGYILGWHLPVFLVALASWRWLTPPMTTMRTLAAGWIALILLRNLAITIVWFGAAHWWLYRRRHQGTRFKFNARWPSTNSELFRFRNQVADNVFWALVSGVPIWTAWEVAGWWLFANHHIPWVSWSAHPVWFVALFLLVPIIRDVHFYAVHRLIHWPPLYRAVHSLHHTNTNVSPWSGLAMHPGEHLAYFSCIAVHWLIPSHPLHALFNGFHAGLMPMPGHAGFAKIEVTDHLAVDTNGYAHYLHHKYFEVNYADGVIPLDRWFGSFHDGSPEAHQRMLRRRRAASMVATNAD